MTEVTTPRSLSGLWRYWQLMRPCTAVFSRSRVLNRYKDARKFAGDLPFGHASSVGLPILVCRTCINTRDFCRCDIVLARLKIALNTCTACVSCYSSRSTIIAISKKSNLEELWGSTMLLYKQHHLHILLCKRLAEWLLLIHMRRHLEWRKPRLLK